MRGFEECTVEVIAALDDRFGIAGTRIPPKPLSATAAEGMIVPSAVRALDRHAAEVDSDVRRLTAWASHLRLPPCERSFLTPFPQRRSATNVPDALTLGQGT